MSKYFKIIVVLILTLSLTFHAKAASNLYADDREVTDYYTYPIYLEKMYNAALYEDEITLQVGAIFENQRNSKIDEEGLDCSKTYFFTIFDAHEDIANAIENYIGGSEVNPYVSLGLSYEDLELVAKVVYLEARGETFEGKVAVAEVVLNRVYSDIFPDDVYHVVYQAEQFAQPRRSTDYTQAEMNAVLDVLRGNGVLNNAEVTYFARGVVSGTTFYEKIGNHYFSY